MPDPTKEFFDGVAQRGPGIIARKYRGTMRFDLRHDSRTEHWYLTMADGSVRVTRESSDADAVVHVDAELFDQLVTSVRDVHAAWLRGALNVEGNIVLLTPFRDLLPPSPGAHDPGVRAWARRLGGGRPESMGTPQPGPDGDQRGEVAS
jgi:hypothetical protein